MDVNIQINTPTLIGSQYFKVWYRLLPSGSFVAIANQTNAQFTITGLTDGNYELKTVLVLDDETECEATFWPFTVVTPVDCIDFTVEIIQASNGLYFLEVSYTPGYNPPCGWQIIHGGGTTTYLTLPASPILIPTQNVTQQVTIVSDGCTGNQKICFDEDVPSITPACTPITVNTVTGQVNNTYPNGDYGVSINFPILQSAPPSLFLTVIINQINVLSGTPGLASYPGFSFGPITSTANNFSIPLVANKNVFGSLLEFNWLIVDGCGQTHTGYVSILL